MQETESEVVSPENLAAARDDLLIVNVAIEAAQQLAERAEVLTGAGQPKLWELSHALGGVDALLSLTERHFRRAIEALRW